MKDKRSFKVGISDDGETILFEGNDKIFSSDDNIYEAYSSEEVTSESNDLGRLLNNEIKSIQFGIGRTSDTGRHAMYYVKLVTNEDDFLLIESGRFKIGLRNICGVRGVLLS